MVGEFNRAILDSVAPETGSLLLEVGTGSGRSTRPLLDSLAAWNVLLVGVDSSHGKLRQLATHSRTGAPNLVQGDAADLPFPSACFDAIITIHVLHLVADWRTALNEFRRLLRPGGVYLRRATEQEYDSVWALMRRMWQSLLEQYDLTQRHAGRSDRAIDGALGQMGAVCRRVQVSARTVCTTPGQELDRIASRARNGTWTVPAEMLPLLLADLETQTIAEFTSLEHECTYDESVELHIWRFPESSNG